MGKRPERLAPLDRPARVRRKRAVLPGEKELWRAVLKDVIPLPGRTAPEEDPPVEPAPPPVPTVEPETLLAPRRRAARSSPAAAKPPPELDPEKPAGLDKRTAERLRRGDLPIEARIDLHGMTQDVAHAALNAFLARAEAAGQRCLLVITGKGVRGRLAADMPIFGRTEFGVLKSAVPRWLNEPGNRARVLALAQAAQRDGGSGALYVLLKRRREA